MCKAVYFFLSFMCSTIAIAQQSDITFIVTGKTSNHRQDHAGMVETLNYHFFAEIFLQPNGEASPSSITTPLASEPVSFSDSGYALEMHGGRYKSEAELENNYPDGEFVFHYTSPSIGTVDQLVMMQNTRTSGSGLPAPPKIFLWQNGESVEPTKIDPNYDLRVTWSEFAEGREDPLGIMDDLLFVIMANCDGERIAHSGRPFENTPFLTYADNSYSISADVMNPESAYQLSVEHAILDTSIEHGVPAFATFATTTFLDLKTTGSAIASEACPSIRQHFDAGQTVLQ